jgi:hypothetical protein
MTKHLKQDKPGNATAFLIVTLFLVPQYVTALPNTMGAEHIPKTPFQLFA